MLSRRKCRRAAGQAGESEVAHDGQLFGLGGHARQPQQGRPLPLVHDAAGGQRLVFGVLTDDDAEIGGVLQGPAQQPRVVGADALVDEQAHAELGQLRHRRQSPLAPPADRHRGTGDDLAERLGGQRLDLPHPGGVVDRRIGVGSGDDRGEPPEHGGPAGADTLSAPSRPGWPSCALRECEPRIHIHGLRQDRQVSCGDVPRDGIADLRLCRWDAEHRLQKRSSLRTSEHSTHRKKSVCGIIGDQCPHAARQCGSGG